MYCTAWVLDNEAIIKQFRLAEAKHSPIFCTVVNTFSFAPGIHQTSLPPAPLHMIINHPRLVRPNTARHKHGTQAGPSSPCAMERERRPPPSHATPESGPRCRRRSVTLRSRSPGSAILHNSESHGITMFEPGHRDPVAGVRMAGGPRR